MSSGKVFQTRGPATAKARLTTVESLTGGTSRRCVMSDDRADRQQERVDSSIPLCSTNETNRHKARLRLVLEWVTVNSAWPSLC